MDTKNTRSNRRLFSTVLLAVAFVLCLTVQVFAEERVGPIGPGYVETVATPQPQPQQELSLEEQRKTLVSRGPAFQQEIKELDAMIIAQEEGGTPMLVQEEGVEVEPTFVEDVIELISKEEEPEESIELIFQEEAETESEEEEAIEEIIATSSNAEPMKDETEEAEFEAHQLIPLGQFKTTAYCPCAKCNGKWTTTATGVEFQENHTVAVDPRVIPLNTTLVINGQEYVAEDTGGAIKGKKIDIFYPTHQIAREYGVQHVEVYRVA